MTTAQLETIVHPNEYFKRSYLLKNMGNSSRQPQEENGIGDGDGGGDVKMEG